MTKQEIRLYPTVNRRIIPKWNTNLKPCDNEKPCKKINRLHPKEYEMYMDTSTWD